MCICGALVHHTMAIPLTLRFICINYQVLIIWLFEAHTAKIKLYNVAINISLFDTFTMAIGPFFLLYDAISMKIINSMKY